MINCKEYTDLAAKIGLKDIHETGDNYGYGSHGAILKVIRRATDLLADDSIGPEWFFSILGDVRKRAGW